MATSNKDFKIKNGLIVEGDSATVNGNDVLTSASSISDLSDVTVFEAENSQVLAYESTTSLWKNIDLPPASSVTISATPPTDPAPAEGNQWFNSSNGTTYIYYDDFWIPVSPPKAGPTGPQGEPGPGIASGGAAGQVLAKSSSTNYDTSWVDVYTPAQTDSAISTAISNLVDSAPTVLDTLNELSAALNDDPNFSTTVTTALAALVPSGTVSQTARSTAPTGYLLCDGSAVSRTTYSSLFDAIGIAYGAGDNSTTFNIPNLKGRIPVGFDSSQSEFDTLGETGGAKTHTLTTAEMPSHTHTQNSHNHTQDSHNHTQNSHNHTQNSHNHTQDSHTHNIPLTNRFVANNDGLGTALQYTPAGGDGSQNIAGTTATNQATTATNQATTATNIATTATNQATTATNQNTGGGGAHNNLQPYVVLNYMIKI